MLKKIGNIIYVDHNTWLTADTHFSNQLTLEKYKRPFKDIEEMDKILINNWNKKVKENDIVIHLGDFGNIDIINQLNGTIYLIKGNHDKNIQPIPNKLMILPCNTVISYDGKLIELVHDPGDYKGYGDYLFFGHEHKMMFKYNGVNVGVELHNYEPISIDDAIYWLNFLLLQLDMKKFLDPEPWKSK